MWGHLERGVATVPVGDKFATSCQPLTVGWAGKHAQKGNSSPWLAYSRMYVKWSGQEGLS